MVRGFRMEPGEIEAGLLRHPLVLEAVVVVLASLGDLRLLLYVVPREQADSASVGWRSFLAGTLPEYMVPSAFVLLADLPRTTSGKVDRKALLAPAGRDKEQEGFVEPRTPLESFLADLWKEVLG